MALDLSQALCTGALADPRIIKPRVRTRAFMPWISCCSLTLPEVAWKSANEHCIVGIPYGLTQWAAEAPAVCANAMGRLPVALVQVGCRDWAAGVRAHLALAHMQILSELGLELLPGDSASPQTSGLELVVAWQRELLATRLLQ